MNSLPDDLKYTALRLYLEGPHAFDGQYRDAIRRITGSHALTKRTLTSATIKHLINEELSRRGMPEDCTDQLVRRIVSDMARDRYIVFQPPIEESCRDTLAAYAKAPRHCIRAVDFRAPNDQVVVGEVARAAADVGIKLIRELGKKKRQIHLGLGAGRSSRYLAKHLADRLCMADDLRKDGVELTVHALSAGYEPTTPLNSPVASFAAFGNAAPKMSFTALFSEAVVPTQRFEEVMTLPGVEEAFDSKDSIDIAFSSLASADSNIGLWKRYAQRATGFDTIKKLTDHDWVGDFQFRPYSAKAAITADVGLRAVTLFEISEFCAMADQPDKHVVLMCGPGKHEALMPLLTVPELKVWDHCVIDVESVEKIKDSLDAA